MVISTDRALVLKMSITFRIILVLAMLRHILTSRVKANVRKKKNKLVIAAAAFLIILVG